jgi:peroxiredoxin
MNQKIKRIFLICIVTATFLLAVNCSAEETTTGTGNITTEPTADQLPAPGRTAPDFSLAGLDGEIVSLKDYRGSPVLLNFWATWCGPCRFEMPFIQEIYLDPDWQAAGVEIIAVNLGESSSEVEEFLSDNGLTFPVLLDSSTEVANRYNIRAIPTTLFIDKDGIIKRIDTGAFASAQEIDERLLELVSGDG